MIKSLVFGSIGAGAALFATALYIQSRPLAFTETAIASDDAVEPVALQSALTTAPLVVEDLDGTQDGPSTVIELPPRVVGPERPAAVPRAAREALTPCSTWRELGPARVSQGVGLDVRHVRELC